MKSEIIQELGEELRKDLREKSQARNILSLIRKILDIEHKGEGAKYRKLKFYCNWALHPEIERIDSVRDLLKGVIDIDDQARMDFFQFKPFYEELEEFAEEYNLSSVIPKTPVEQHLMGKLLSQIYSNTPLIIKDVKKKIIWINSGTGEYSYGGSFKITDIL
jgi:hypothetical protein